jgi:hypothetical protein
LPKFTLSIGDGPRLRPDHLSDDRVDFTIPASGQVSLLW